MPETKTYTGGCHCGEVRFEVTADLSSVVTCTCSLCQKRGALWTFVTPEQFALRAGSNDLKDYQFGKKAIHHLFCPQCGVGAFSRGTTPKGGGWSSSGGRASAKSLTCATAARTARKSGCTSAPAHSSTGQVTPGRWAWM